MRSDFRNVSEQPQCVTEGNSKGQAGADASFCCEQETDVACG